MGRDYDRIPELLRWERNWCLAGPDERGHYKAPHALGPRGIFNIKPTQSNYLKDFETILDSAEFARPCGIGFVLTTTGVYTCIDLDIKNIHNYPNKVDHAGKPIEWTSEEDIARFHQIIKAFNSYTEISSSGQGFHIWVRGNIGEGLKRDGVEIYSQERFIVCTGDVYLDRDIENRQEMLEVLAAEIKQNADIASDKVELVELPEVDSDQTIFERARVADNADKFISLCNGNFESYPSQSEADLALLSIFAFYTKSNAQCRRLFRMTRLGERPKATKNDVAINRILRIIRGREATESKLDVYAAASTAALLANMRIAPPASTPSAPQALAPIPVQLTQQNAPASAITVNQIPFPEELTYIPPVDDYVDDGEIPPGSTLTWPPGLVGRMARYIFDSSMRPVREVAIVSAMGLMAGVCGKAYNIPKSGLNLYIVLVARSALGKEALHGGISDIMGHINPMLSAGMRFVDFIDYASGPALSKAVAANPSFVNVSGEWGRKQKRLALEDGRDGPMQQLRTVMTNLYQKSGANSIVGGIGYSDKDKNVVSVAGAAYSMIGESTPSAFYDSLTDNMMEDGFLSRFTVVEYNGNRPPTNPNAATIKPEQSMLDDLCAVMQQALTLNERYNVQYVDRSPDAAEILNAFDKECDAEIDKSDDEGWRQMWNRAQLKALRIAALLAIGDNFVLPVMHVVHVTWAIDLIRKDINVMRRRINTGDVGIGDAPRERKILSIIKKFLEQPVPPGYGVSEKMRLAGVVPRKYLQMLTQRQSSFVGHRNGQNIVLDATIKSLIDSGYILELSKDKALTKYEFHGRCFQVITLPLNTEERKEHMSNRAK